MRITGAVLTGVHVPYSTEIGPVVTAGLRLEAAEHVIVELTTDVGLTGLGEGVPRPSVYGETIEGMVAAIATLLIPPIIGLDPWATEQIRARWSRVVGNTATKAAVDMCLYDLQGQAAGVPIHRLLGGSTESDRIPVGMAIAMGSREAIIRQAHRAVELGFETIKLKVGTEPQTDVGNVAALRAAVGPGPIVYVDANGGYNRADALRAARGFEEHGVAFLEELLPVTDREGRVRLAGLTEIPLLADESTNSIHDLQREIAAGAVGAISLRAVRSGFSDARRVVTLAELAHLPTVVGSHRELGIGTAASVHLAAAFATVGYAAELGTHLFVEHSLLAEPLTIDRGQMRLPTGPGLGVALDRDALERYSTWTRVVEPR